MSNWLTVAKMILSLLPAIIEAVKAIESVLPDSNQGAEKLALIKGVLQGAYKAGSSAVGTFEDLWPRIEDAIAAVVKFFNSTGVFKKS
jgi:hypothetical protein